MSLLSVMVMSLPLQAQVVIDNTEQETKEEEPADDKDELAVSDSLMVDSLASDSLPWPHAVQVGLDNLLKSKMFETSQVGIMVWDLEADSCIYRFRERQLMRPASTMKLVTAITALDRLGGSYQFKTTLKYTGTVENGVLNGDIYCVGGMDPRFNTDDMTAFVTSLKELGVDSIQGSIYADRSMKDEDLLGEGWCWDDDNPVLSPLVFGRKDLFMDRFLSKLKDAGIFYAGFGASVKRCPQGAFHDLYPFPYDGPDIAQDDEGERQSLCREHVLPDSGFDRQPTCQCQECEKRGAAVDTQDRTRSCSLQTRRWFRSLALQLSECRTGGEAPSLCLS